ncbi:hypothetical protein [Streptomyces anandii]|uniref:hypothetical protein n=1 Tax=Streptomyces anandii TaxID=285454 RepID=UPI001E3A34E1|nr:hypothetical protein [Streptomyces anandii]
MLMTEGALSSPSTATWPTANGSQAVTATIPVSGTKDYGRKRLYGSGDLGTGSQDEDQGPIPEGGRLAGINSPTSSHQTIVGDSGRKIVPCRKYVGNNTGKEPTKKGTDADGAYCKYAASDITYK